MYEWGLKVTIVQAAESSQLCLSPPQHCSTSKALDTRISTDWLMSVCQSRISRAAHWKSMQVMNHRHTPSKLERKRDIKRRKGRSATPAEPCFQKKQSPTDEEKNVPQQSYEELIYKKQSPISGSHPWLILQRQDSTWAAGPPNCPAARKVTHGRHPRRTSLIATWHKGHGTVVYFTLFSWIQCCWTLLWGFRIVASSRAHKLSVQNWSLEVVVAKATANVNSNQIYEWPWTSTKSAKISHISCCWNLQTVESHHGLQSSESWSIG